jgi:hypothetical protein
MYIYIYRYIYICVCAKCQEYARFLMTFGDKKVFNVSGKKSYVLMSELAVESRSRNLMKNGAVTGTNSPQHRINKRYRYNYCNHGFQEPLAIWKSNQAISYIW